MGYSPPGSSVHGILQARILEWFIISSSRGIVPIQGLILCLLEVGSLPLVPHGKPAYEVHTPNIHALVGEKCP